MRSREKINGHGSSAHTTETQFRTTDGIRPATQRGSRTKSSRTAEIHRARRQRQIHTGRLSSEDWSLPLHNSKLAGQVRGGRLEGFVGTREPSGAGKPGRETGYSVAAIGGPGVRPLEDRHASLELVGIKARSQTFTQIGLLLVGQTKATLSGQEQTSAKRATLIELVPFRARAFLFQREPGRVQSTDLAVP